MELRCIQTFTIDELSPEARKSALKWLAKIIHYDYVISDAHKSFEVFAEKLNIKRYEIDYVNGYFTLNNTKDNNFHNLTGIRAAKYIWNNFSGMIYKPRYYSVRDHKPYIHKRVTSRVLSNGKYFCSYHSAIQLEETCALTGVCYDMSLVEPFKLFMDKPDGRSIHDLIYECVRNLVKDTESEITDRLSESGLIDFSECQEYVYDEFGTMFRH